MKRILLLVTVTSMLAAALALSGVAQAQSDPEPPCGTAVADQYCIDKTATPGTVAVGDQITFTIRQRCPGNPQGCLAFAQAPIVDTLPSGLTDVSYPAACTQSGNTLTCAENRFFTETQPYTLTIVATTTECGTFTNTAGGESVTFTVEGCPPPPPTMKEQCKKGGFMEFGYPDQGTCISDVNRRNR
jgi:hypothetical protein